MGAISFVFNTFLIDPLTNFFVLLTALTGNAGIAVILLTIVIRVVTLPLQLRQMHTTRMMAAMAPRLQELNKKYKDPRRRSEEQMKLYREAGVNPLGCFSSMLLQMPILIALYQTFRVTVGEAPEALISLSDRLYAWSYLRESMPLPPDFLWLHLGRPDPLVLPILVAATTYVLNKMASMPATDDRQRAQMGMMNLLMPLIFGWITITLPSGLGLYYVLSNVVGIGMQYAYVGGGPFNWRALMGMSQEPVLPRGLEVRARHADAAKKLGRPEEEQAEEEAKPQAATEATRRRRRYAGGRRRGRR